MASTGSGRDNDGGWFAFIRAGRGAGVRRTALKATLLAAMILFLPAGQLRALTPKGRTPTEVTRKTPPNLDVLVTTNLRDPEYAKAYLKSLGTGGPMRKGLVGFRARKITLEEGKELGAPAADAAPYLLAVDHKGSVSVGDKYLILRGNQKEDLARSSNPSQKVGSGYFYEWYVRVAQEGTVRFRLLKNAGDKYVQMDAWSMTVEMPHGVADDRGYVKIDSKYLLEKDLPEGGPVDPADKDAALRRLAPIRVPEDKTLEGRLVSRSIVREGAEKDGKVPVTLSIKNRAPWSVQARVAGSAWSEAVKPGASDTVTVLRSATRGRREDARQDKPDNRDDTIEVQFLAD